jgi:FkbM family methyltransferase
MKPLHKMGIVGKIAKSMIPLASSSATALRMQGLLRYAEIGTELLQGKGAGAGWDLEAEVRAAAACIRRPNPVLLDVGANYGHWAEGMVRSFPGTQKVVLFEPQEECIATLDKLDLPGKVVVPSAVGDQPGSQTFYVGTQGWAGASLYKREETFFTEVEQRKITISVTTLDHVVEKEGIEFVDFAKFDIEGAELAALRGASQTFSRGAIGAMSLEFGSGNINSRTFFRDFWGLLTGHGFEIFRVLPGGRTLRIRQYYEDLEHFRGVSNYIARRAVFDART